MINSSIAKALLGAAVVAGTVTAISGSASAISVKTGGLTVPGNGQISQYGGVKTIDFDNPNPSGVTISGGTVVSGSVSNEYASPPGDSTKYLTVGSPGKGNSATFNFAEAQGYFGLFVGSLDTYNSIVFFNTVKGTNQAFTGTEVAQLTGTPATGDQNVGVYYNFFGDTNNDLFDKVVLSSSQAAFEVDNIAFRRDIPTPALLPGLIGMGVVALRKKRKEAAEQVDA